MKLIIGSKGNTINKWIYWIGNFAQIIYDSSEKYGFGYCDQFKSYGILEDGTFIKAFYLNHIIIYWCVGEKYRKKHNISYDN